MNNVKPKNDNVIVIGVAGIIGVGKSTTLNRLKTTRLLQEAIVKRRKDFKQPIQFEWMLEPTHVWQSMGWLKQFYKDPERFGLCFQFGVFNTHVDALEDIVSKRHPGHTLIIIVERTMYCQRLFWELQYDLNRVVEMENQVYIPMWNKWRRLIPEPDMIVFLKTSSLDVAMSRVHNRSRDGEKGGVTRDYQEKLLAKHEAWYTQPIARPPGSNGIRCVHIKADEPFHTNIEVLKDLADNMAAHIVHLIK